MSNSSKTKTHAMTVDVEDYFHVSAFESVISPNDWDSISLRVADNTNRLIDLFNENDVKATFFTLGWVAKRCPELVKRIVNEGHEIASHGLNHRRNTSMSRAQVRTDIGDSKAILEDITGRAIQGYRAPSFSIDESNEYVFELLVEFGFKYSSSTYPISHDLYGVPHWPRFAHKRQEGLIEIPIPTIQHKGINKGIGGGGYFRLFPYWLSKRRIERYVNSIEHPYNFYFHPWEIDPEQPRVDNAPFKSKLRHYINLGAMENKLVKLMRDYKWSSMNKVYEDLLRE
ncbi:polysaccharide deacetylase [Agaribacter marinus]|uniref:Polysaccharide deacetylase n=2 Tax=Agaribacter marinus TaxID=1431249 RepID=A0AA37WK30_9ALTE|nr:polysaccharide deacetylase [Agaribacter marinus]